MNDEHRRFLLSILDDAANAKVYADWLEENQVKGARRWRISRQPKTLAFREFARRAGNSWASRLYLINNKFKSYLCNTEDVADGLSGIICEHYGVPAEVVSVTQPECSIGSFAILIARTAWLANRSQYSPGPDRRCIV